MKDPISKLRSATRRAKSDVANKLVSMCLHEMSRRISQDALYAKKSAMIPGCWSPCVPKGGDSTDASRVGFAFAPLQPVHSHGRKAKAPVPFPAMV
jgi:hypothetical protein